MENILVNSKLKTVFIMTTDKVTVTYDLCKETKSFPRSLI